jgi:hypothetical protein
MQAIDLDMKVAIGQQQLKLLQIEKAIQAEQNPQPPAQHTKPPSVAIHYADLPPEGQQQAAAQAGIQISPQQAQQKQAFDSAQAGQQGPLGPQPAPGTPRQELTMQPQKQNINTNEARQSPLSTPVI